MTVAVRVAVILAGALALATLVPSSMPPRRAAPERPWRRSSTTLALFITR